MSGGLSRGSDGSFDADDLSEIRERFKEVNLGSQLKLMSSFGCMHFFLSYLCCYSFLSVSSLAEVLKFISLYVVF